MKKLELKVGEVVVEPSTGICTVEGLRRMQIDGRMDNFYIFQSGKARIMIPQSQVPSRGIRKPMSRALVKKMLSLLKVPVSPVRDETQPPYIGYREIVRTGDPMKINRLLRELYILDQGDELRGKERDLLEYSKRLLCDEISFVKNLPKIKVMEDINKSLEAMYKKKLAKDRQKAKSKQ
jgi:RNA polymerase-interacting CarD/CdnL/TRCF family regulator